MLKSHTLALRASEIRQRLNEIAGLSGDKLTDEVRAEADKLSAEYRDNETQYRAALIGEDGAPATDPADREFRSLNDRVSLATYMRAAVTGEAVTGREAELIKEHGLGAGQIPVAALAPRARVQHRADVPTSAPDHVSVTPTGILARVFAMSSAEFLGVAMPMVGAGEIAYPVITAAPAASFQDKDAAQESTAATVGIKTAAPIRLTARYSLRREDLAILPSMEEALRSDLSGALSDRLDEVIIAGNGTAPNPAGFLGAAANGGLAAVGSNPAAIVDFEELAETIAGGVDGLYATSERDVRLLVGTSSYGVLAAAFRDNTSESATAYAMRMSAGLRASANVAAPASHFQDAILRRGARTTEAYAPVWSGATVIRDELSDAGKGWIHLTIIMLTTFVRVRDDSFKRVRFKVSE